MAKRLYMEDAFKDYVEELSASLRHTDRKSPLGEYMTGLLLPRIQGIGVDKWPFMNTVGLSPYHETQKL